MCKVFEDLLHSVDIARKEHDWVKCHMLLNTLISITLEKSINIQLKSIKKNIPYITEEE